MDLPVYFHELKFLIEQSTFLSRDALHIYGGTLFYLIWLSLFKNEFSTRPLWIIFFLIGINESLDIFLSLRSNGRIYWTASFLDFFNTLLLPVLLYLFFRYKLNHSIFKKTDYQ